MSKKTNKTVKKAVTTRRARREFRDQYGEDTYQAVRYLVRGKNSGQVSVLTGIAVPSVAAIAANLTRGTYDHVVDACNF